MPVQAESATRGRISAVDRPRRSRGDPHPKRSISASEARALRVDKVLRAVGGSIPLDKFDLPGEFFPAHVSVAIVDAVFRSLLGAGGRPASPAERYCRRFGVARRRADAWELPESGEQETLADLVSHYDELGVDAMADDVFQNRSCFPGTSIGTAQYVLNAARALRGIGVNILQDIHGRRPEEIDDALRALPGAGENLVRRILMYTGGDDFVLGDEPVRKFVAHALGRDSVATGQAAKLVRESAYELVVSPRYLDYRIWQYGRCSRTLNREASPA